MVIFAQENSPGFDTRSVLFNVFQNDLMYMVSNICDIYNYADDNTVWCLSNNIEHLTTTLQRWIGEMLKWFESNYMHVNPNTFQLIIFDKQKTNAPVAISSNTVLNPLDSCKLFGIQVDRQLMFSSHVASICSKAGK